MHGTIDVGIRVAIRPLPEAIADVSTTAALRDLIARAAAPNVFYEPAFMAAAVPLYGGSVQAGLVWRGARLIGFFPVSVAPRRYGVPLPVLVGWTHPYAPLGTPLIDRDAADAVVAAWLDHLAGDPALPRLLLLPYLPIEGAVAAGFERASRPAAQFGLHRRALLAPGDDRAGYPDRALAPKKRKELRRQRRRLAEDGRLTTEQAATPEAIAAALADFLALEAVGWKGRAGTAALCDQASHDLVREAVTALATTGQAAVMRLRRADRTLAAAITLRSGDTAWLWKIAYDETFARASPGLQLVTDVTEMLLADPSLAQVDSCATPDHPMIDHVWRERLILADRLIGLAGGLAFSGACRLEQLRRTAIAAAKQARALWRRR